MKKFKIDILMTIHNGEDFLKETISSLKAQTFQDWELVIVNNYSTDNTSKLLEKIEQDTEKIKVFNTSKLLSRPKALNYGLGLCKNDYIGILDADDLVSPDWLNDVKKIINENENFGALIGNYIPIDENSKKIKKKKLFKFSQGIINHALNYTFPCAHSGSIFKKKILDRFEYPYENDLLTGHDWRLFLKISFFENILFIDRDWVFWRRYSGSVTAKNQITSKSDILKNLIYVKKQKLKFSIKLKKIMMILIQLYHLLKLFFINKKLINFFLTLIILFFTPIFWFNKYQFMKIYLKKINE